jgi:hypothetical protein
MKLAILAAGWPTASPSGRSPIKGAGRDGRNLGSLEQDEIARLASSAPTVFEGRGG